MTPYTEAQRKITHSSELTEAIRSSHAEVERDQGVPMTFIGFREEPYVEAGTGRVLINVYAQFSRTVALPAQTNPLNPHNLNDSAQAPFSAVTIDRPRDRSFDVGANDLNLADAQKGAIEEPQAALPAPIGAGHGVVPTSSGETP